MKHLVLWAFLSPLATFAQVQKCQIDGKTVYSDSECGQSGVAVNVKPNSLDTSGLRAQIASDKAKEAAQQRAAAVKVVKVPSGKPGPCDHIRWKGAAPTADEAGRMRDCMSKAAREMRRP